MKTLFLIATFIVVTHTNLFTNEVISGESVQPFSANETVNFFQLAEKYGYQTEEYEVKTEDGYLLGLFRIRGERGLPILLMHGLSDCSDTWLIRGKSSLGITLAGLHYDVWFANIRGNRYSRRHVNLDPDKDASFWDYSFHEHGIYDLPAIIDTILWQTGHEKLNAFAHSQGNTIFYVLGSTRPKYNEKINVMAALSPVCFLNNLPPPLSFIIEIAPKVNDVLAGLGVNELFGDSGIGRAIRATCSTACGYSLCFLGVLSPLSGFDVAEITPSIFDAVIQYYPAATSRKNLYHWSQIGLRGRFSRFDYRGERNLLEYNSSLPPDYDLSKVSMPIVLLAGSNDKVSLIENVNILSQKLPNVVKYIVIGRKLMNHLDYVWGENMDEYLFPYIFDILAEYN